MLYGVGAGSAVCCCAGRSRCAVKFNGVVLHISASNIDLVSFGSFDICIVVDFEVVEVVYIAIVEFGIVFDFDVIVVVILPVDYITVGCCSDEHSLGVCVLWVDAFIGLELGAGASAIIDFAFNFRVFVGAPLELDFSVG